MKHYERTYPLFLALVGVLMVGTPLYAAEISKVSITSTTASSTTITWHTDVNTDATINYGLDSSFGVVRDSSVNSTVHTLNVSNLDPATTYHFQVMSTDDQGNKSATAGFVFTTTGSPVQKIKTEISKIKDSKALEQIADQVKQTLSVVIKPPALQGAPKVIASTNGATITWTTDRESNSMVALEGDPNFQPGGSYSINQGNPGDSTTNHSVDVIGLEPSTLYHFQASSEDAAGLSGKTDDDSFTTKSIVPVVSGLKISRIQETSAVVSWSTGNVPAQGLVDFTDQRTKKTKTTGDPAFASNHSILLAGLTLGTRYTVVARAINKGGDEEDSKPVTFVTVRDVIPPIISKVDNESTLFPSDDVKIQTIITWVTDEPANCQLFYTQGLVHNETNNGTALPEEANPLTLHTQVVVGFAPSSVYKFWTICHDASKNRTQSDDYVLITPTKEQNIIDLILANFQGTFGWLNNIGGAKK